MPRMARVIIQRIKDLLKTRGRVSAELADAKQTHRDYTRRANAARSQVHAVQRGVADTLQRGRSLGCKGF